MEILAGLVFVITSFQLSAGNGLRLLDSCICPNHNITFQCTTVGGGLTVWQGSAFQCPQSSNEIFLRHAQFLGSVGVCNDGAICAHAVSIQPPDSFVSNLTVHVTPALEGRTVRCEHDDGVTVSGIGSFTLNITRRPLSGPLNVILTHASPHHLTFSWTPISNSCQVQSYAIDSSNCGVCPSYMNMTTARCIGFQVPAECRFTVRTVVCGNIVGSVGTEVSFTLQVPPPPRIINCTLSYSINNTLSRIVTAFTAVNLSNTTITDTINGSTMSYTSAFTAATNGSICGLYTVPASSCMNGVCIQEFDVATSSCSPSIDIIVEVFGTNIFGNGPSSNPIIKDGFNNFVRVEAQSDRIICTFLDEQDDEKSCSIAYGHDCQHLNPETLMGQTQGGNTVTVPLLRRTEVYCYLVTATSGDTSINIIGNFNDEDSSVHQSKSNLAVVIVIVITSVVAVLVIITILSFFSLLVWYRMSNKSFKDSEDPPTYFDLLKMSTIADDVPQDIESDPQVTEEYYGITYKDLLLLKTGDD